jgi:hypothetical protein
MAVNKLIATNFISITTFKYKHRKKRQKQKIRAT